MGTTAVSVLEQRLAEGIGDWVEVAVTTYLTTNNSVISTNLNALDSGRDDYFNDWWCYITDKNNAGKNRQISDYTTPGGTLSIRGAALVTDGTEYATVRLHRYNREKYIAAFNDTIRELSDVLFKYLDVSELVTGNILPNSHFRDWTLSTYPDKWTLSSANITATAYTTAGGYWGGTKSMNALTGAAGANSYVYVTSDNWPALLDTMGKTVSAYVWAYPQTADDATIVLYTIKADGTTTQTLTSTTACPAGKWTLLKLENQAINDDIVNFQFRLAVASNSKYVYFDHARLIGTDNTKYLLPNDFRDGKLARVEIQTSGYSDKICDDLRPNSWETCYDWIISNDGTDKYLELPYYPSSSLIRLRGTGTLSTVSAYTDTIEIDGDKLNLFIAYAKYKLYQAIEGPVSSQDVGRYESNSAKAYGEYLRLLPSLRMNPPKTTMKLSTY